jgi:hypothetical protein
MRTLAASKHVLPVSRLERAAAIRQMECRASLVQTPAEGRVSTGLLKADMMALTADVDRGLNCSVLSFARENGRILVTVHHVASTS